MARRALRGSLVAALLALGAAAVFGPRGAPPESARPRGDPPPGAVRPAGEPGGEPHGRPAPTDERPPPGAPGASSTPGSWAGALDPALDEEEHCEAGRPPTLPSGAAPSVPCGAAQQVVAQVRTRAVGGVQRPDVRAFAEAVRGWLDPHGMWSAAPDSPVAPVLRREAAALLDELGAPEGTPCAAALRVGEALAAWTGDLRAEAERAADRVRRRPRDAAGGGLAGSRSSDAAGGGLAGSRSSDAAGGGLAKDGGEAGAGGARRPPARGGPPPLPRPLFEDDPVRRPGRALAAELGARLAEFERHGDPLFAQVAGVARERFFPPHAAARWAGVVLAAALRAWVPAVDVHGAWVPLEEEWSLYVDDVAGELSPRLWDSALRTPAGFVVVGGAVPPLAVGDHVLGVGGVLTAGLSLEALEQLAHLEPVGGESVRTVHVLRPGEGAPRLLTVALEEEDEPDALGGPAAGEPGFDSVRRALDLERVRYGEGEALIVHLEDVPDGLGEELAAVVAEEGARPPVGLLLDLRGNVGGSTDGAAGAIGVFLPGVPSFPFRNSAGVIELQHALTPVPSGTWRGPVASLVDGGTASAAEMVAGALGAYQRGPVLGRRTFGKGCVQEHFDDRPGVGVLRLTTLVFALPDGAPLQRTGLTPSLPLPLPPSLDREDHLMASPPAWTGPDVREHRAVGGPAWPPHAGKVGPCRDPWACAALRRLGERRAPAPGAVRARTAARAGTAPDLQRNRNQ